MKQIQKRYIYSALVASIFFIIGYGILDINILITLLLTIVLYIGGIFLFKEKDIREFNSENVNHYYFLASKLANRANNMEDDIIKEKVAKITTLTDQILVSLEQRPKKVEQVFDFFDYYLDITYKLLYRCKAISQKGATTDEENKFIKNIYSYLDGIIQSFEKQLKNMHEAKMIDINSEIMIFEKTIGFKNSDIEVGENNAEQ